MSSQPTVCMLFVLSNVSPDVELKRNQGKNAVSELHSALDPGVNNPETQVLGSVATFHPK